MGARLEHWMSPLAGRLLTRLLSFFARRPKHAARPDANQLAIVRRLGQLGFLVINVAPYLSTPDLFVWGYDADLDQHRWTAWEIKTDKGTLTKSQQVFMQMWPGAIKVCRSLDDILKAYGQNRQGA